MPNQIIISMKEFYPFGGCQLPEKENREVLIRKKINTGENVSEHIEKAKYLKKLKIPFSVQIKSIFFNCNSLQIYYEYVPVKFEIWMKNMSDQLSNNLLKELYILATFLSDNHIDTILNIQNLGCDQQFHIRYFINFQKTFLNDKLSPNTLKEKYYREISLLLKEFNSTNQRIQTPDLFYSAKISPSTIKIPQNRISLQSINRTPSLGIFQQKKRKNIYNLTQNQHQQQKSQNETDNYKVRKISAQKIKYKQNLNDLLKTLKQKIQNLKERQRLTCKLEPQSSLVKQFDKNNSLNSKSIKKTSILKKSVNQYKLTRGISIDNLAKNNEMNGEFSPIIYRNTVQMQNTSLAEKLPTFNYGSSIKHKSQKNRTPKNSQSPVEYLDIVKSGQQYVQDFLNVLEDSFQQRQNDDSFLFNQFKATQTADTENGDKWLKIAQQSQYQNNQQQEKWNTRFSEAMLNSKKLINKIHNLKVLPKLMDTNFSP